MQNLRKRLGLDYRMRRENLRRYLLQCALAAVAILILLLVLDAVTQTVLIAALGASVFIAFAVPLSLHSDPRHMIGGYLVGLFCGSLLSILHDSLHFDSVQTTHTVMIIFCALATGLAMFTMVITNTEHPPAVALAIGLLLNEWDLLTLVVVVAGIMALTVLKKLVLPLLYDLL